MKKDRKLEVLPMEFLPGRGTSTAAALQVLHQGLSCQKHSSSATVSQDFPGQGLLGQLCTWPTTSENLGLDSNLKFPLVGDTRSPAVAVRQAVLSQADQELPPTFTSLVFFLFP